MDETNSIINSASHLYKGPWTVCRIPLHRFGCQMLSNTHIRPVRKKRNIPRKILGWRIDLWRHFHPSDVRLKSVQRRIACMRPGTVTLNRVCGRPQSNCRGHGSSEIGHSHMAYSAAARVKYRTLCAAAQHGARYYLHSGVKM